MCYCQVQICFAVHASYCTREMAEVNFEAGVGVPLQMHCNGYFHVNCNKFKPHLSTLVRGSHVPYPSYNAIHADVIYSLTVYEMA